MVRAVGAGHRPRVPKIMAYPKTSQGVCVVPWKVGVENDDHGVASVSGVSLELVAILCGSLPSAVESRSPQRATTEYFLLVFFFLNIFLKARHGRQQSV